MADLRTQLAKAIWEAGPECPCPWNKLYASEREEWLECADAALKFFRDKVLLPEYGRWRDSENVESLGAVANMVATVTLAKKD